MHGHFYEGNGADSCMLEVVKILQPWVAVGLSLVVFGVVVVEGIEFGIYELDVVVELWERVSSFSTMISYDWTYPNTSLRTPSWRQIDWEQPDLVLVMQVGG